MARCCNHNCKKIIVPIVDEDINISFKYDSYTKEELKELGKKFAEFLKNGVSYVFHDEVKKRL